jgi:hypothetical protein
VGSAKFALVADINRRIMQASWAATMLVNKPTSMRVWSTSTLQVPGSVKPGSIKGGLVQRMEKELLLYEFPPSADGESGTFFVLSTDLQTESQREVTVVTRPDIKSTLPVEGCAFVGSTACDLHRIGNILPLTLAAGSGQLVTFAAPPAPPPFAPPAPPARPEEGDDLQRWLRKIEGKEGTAALRALEKIVKEVRQIALDEAAQE